jgi:hypothetical protein
LDFVVQSAHKWLWRTEVVQAAFAEHTGPKHLLRYEDLLEDPVSRLGELFTWLGLETNAEQLTALVARHAFEGLAEDDRGPQRFYRAATPGMWRSNLTDQEQAAVHSVIGAKLGELGYAT